MARIERYLPATAKIVIERPGHAAEHYTTRKDVTLPEQPTYAECPITGAELCTTLESGIRLYYHGRQTRGRVVLDDGDLAPDAADTQFCLFHYDVPSGGDYPNPSPKLYPIGVRLTESAWLMRAGDIPYNLMAEMQDNGCTVEVNRFDPAESARLLRQAVGRLHQDLADAVERANEAMERATDALAAAEPGAEGGPTPEEAQRQFASRAKGIERRLALLQKQIGEAAERFGIRPHAVNLERLGLTAAAIRTEMSERARVYRDGVAALAAAGTAETAALAAAAAQSQVPAEVMADALREAGNEAAADALQAAFAVEAAPQPAAEDDGTFSLADLADLEDGDETRAA